LAPEEFLDLLGTPPTFVVVDVEATGGKFPPERMMELGMVRIAPGESWALWESLFNPEREIPPFVSELTGIRQSMVQAAPSFGQCADAIEEFTQNCWLVGHPVTFDYRFLRHEMALAGHDFVRPLLCTQQLARFFIPEQPSYSLGKLCRALGIDTLGRHRALGDARLTASLFQRIFDVAMQDDLPLDKA
jgi:DNA polymerase-3 subunit epsilon